ERTHTHFIFSKLIYHMLHHQFFCGLSPGQELLKIPHINLLQNSGVGVDARYLYNNYILFVFLIYALGSMISYYKLRDQIHMDQSKSKKKRSLSKHNNKD
ncbi:hypothetical protein ACJX0J_028388, partial [Zea mays]